MTSARISEQPTTGTWRPRGAVLQTSDTEVRERLSGWLRQALQEFREHDAAILDVNVSEWACVFRLGVCLTRYVDRDWDIDSEYNRPRPRRRPEATFGRHRD